MDTLQEPLIDSYRRAWERVMFEQQLLELQPLAYRRKLRLTEMRKAIEAEMDALDSQAAEWVSRQLPQAYGAGMTSSVGASAGTWSQIHQEAVQRLSAELFSELLQATQGVRDSTKELVRTVARDQALRKAIEGRTANQAAKEMRRVLGEKGIYSVTYADGSRHGLAEYSAMAMRTTTAKAYNSGTLNAHADVKFFEIFDGPNCGLSSHDDPRLALGMVVDRATCEAYPISHPNCRRSFGPRPDILRKDFAEKANPSSTAAQRRAQLEADAARGDQEAIRELAGQRKADDVFTKRQARLDAQRERNRLADREAADRAKKARLAERQAKLDERRLGEDQARVMREAQERAEREAAKELFPDFPKLPAPEAYTDAYISVNPGAGVPARRNNCHFVAPSMEMRARGYDVIASPTFINHGRFDHSIEKDWVDPATGEQRKFSGVQTTKFVRKRDPGTRRDKTVQVDLTAEQIRKNLEDKTASWPAGARGFLIGHWKRGSGHIWNVYKDERGELQYIDGQVQLKDARKYLGEVKVLRVLRVDDLEPTERLRLPSKPNTGVPAPVGVPDQKELGLRMFEQALEDAPDSQSFYYGYQTMLDDLRKQLGRLNIKDPLAEVRARAARRAT